MMTNETMQRPADVSAGENTAQNAPDTTHTVAEDSKLDTADLITLVRRAPALAALREQPLDRRDLQERLDVSKPTVHRLTRALEERGLVQRSNGIFVLTELGNTVADIVAEFIRNIETANRLTPLLETLEDGDPTIDVGAFTDATVTIAGPGDPYRPVRRYYSLIEETETLRGFDIAPLSPNHIDTVHRRIRDEMETDFTYPPDVAARLLSTHPDRMAELFESGHLVLRIHADLPHGLAILDEQVAVAIYCETTGALRALIDTDSAPAREWADGVCETYRSEATELSEHPELSQLSRI